MQTTKTHKILSLLFVFALALSLALVLGVSLRSKTASGQITNTFSVTSDAAGTITSGDGGISCGGDCTENYAQGVTVTLTANPGSNRAVNFWSVSGASCNEGTKASTCTFSMPGQSISAKVYWKYALYNVTVAKVGTGSGTVTSSPAGISCGGDCVGQYADATSFTLTATPASDSLFVRWETPSGGANICYDHAKGTSATPYTTPTCQDTIWSPYNLDYKAVARFDKKTTTTTTTPTSQTNRSTTSTTPTTPTTATKPEAPKLDKVRVGDQDVDTTQPIKLAADKPLILSGKTLPNAVVTLFIFSEPQTATVTADAEGNWSYAIEGLPAGDHHVEMAVTANGQTSDRANVLAFTVEQATEAAQNNASTTGSNKKSSKLPLIIGGVLLLLASGGGAGWWFWWRKRQKPVTPVVPPVDPPKLP